MKNCRNCGSPEIYENRVAVEMARTFAKVRWDFNLQVCTACGLADWFMRPEDLDWVKRNFAHVPPSTPRRDR